MSYARQTWRGVLPHVRIHERAAIGIALRRRHLDIVVGDGAAALQTHVSFPENMQVEMPPMLPRVLQAIQRLLDEQNIAATTLCGIGIGMSLTLTAHAPSDASCSGDGASLGALLRDAFGLPVFLNAQTNMATLGENQFGAGRGVNNMLYVSLDSTVTAGLMMNGKLHHGSAGALGHMAVNPAGDHCHCGQRGCLETSAGAAAIIATAQSQGSPVTSMTQLIDAANRGDAGCLAGLEHAGMALGMAIANVAMLMNPDMIVLGGATMHAGELLLAPIRQTIRQNYRLARALPARIASGTLGSSAVALGGMISALTMDTKSLVYANKEQALMLTED